MLWCLQQLIGAAFAICIGVIVATAMYAMGVPDHYEGCHQFCTLDGYILGCIAGLFMLKD